MCLPYQYIETKRHCPFASLMQCSKEPNLLYDFKAREQLYSHKENDSPLLAKVLYVLGGVLSILSVT